MKQVPTKVDGVDSLSVTEFNPNQDELENAVTASDQTLDGLNTNQLGEAMSRYGSGGADFYQDSGAVNAYILTGVGSFIKPAVYFDGMSVKFYTANTNTGPSTINVASIGVKDLVLTDGSALVGGEVIAGSLIIATYDLASDKVRLNPIADLSSPPAIGGGKPISVGGPVIKANTRLEGPRGRTTPATVKATTFEGDAGGTTINEFSTDGTLAGNSDNAVPTEKAVKTFVETSNVASQVEMEAATSTTKKVSPGRQKFHPSACKAWITFNGTGTIAIVGSYNITSITDNGTGRYTITLATNFSNTAYTFMGFARDSDATGDGWVSATLAQQKSVGSADITTLVGSGAIFDSPEINLTFFGDQ